MVQPTLTLAGLIVPQQNLAALTTTFLSLKLRFNPGLRRGHHFLDCARQEIKGSDLRADIRRKGRNRRRAVVKFLESVLDLLDAQDARLVAKIYVKGPGKPFAGIPAYTAAMQAFCSHFQQFLVQQESTGIIVADYRTPALNSRVSHSIFTQKYRVGGDPFSRIMDMPTFGHSENHVPLQITDLLCSTILTPMATSAYCAGHVISDHVHPRDDLIRTTFADRIRAMTFRYYADGRWQGGLTVNDAIARRSQSLMFASMPALRKTPIVNQSENLEVCQSSQ
jgi:hypothetical protein